jgi:hypothetical protein
MRGEEAGPSGFSEFGEGPGAQGVTIINGCRYQMFGEFLVDGETGDVWKYNARKKNLEIVYREEDEIGTLMEVVAGYDLIDGVHAARPKIAEDVHHSEVEKYEIVLDATVKAINKRVEKLLKELE